MAFIVGAVLYFVLAKAGMESKVLEMPAAPADAPPTEAPAAEAAGVDQAGEAEKSE
jgi:hypothetical protein